MEGMRRIALESEKRSTRINIVKESVRRDAFLPSWKAALYHSAYLSRSAIFKAIREEAPTFTGYLLDFGCGSKPYRKLFTDVSGYVGVDIEQSGHDHLNSDIDVFYDGNHLPFEDGKFDGVVSFEVFEHVFNLQDVLTEIRRVMVPGGRLMFTIPFGWGEHEQPYDFARYTSFGITHLLQASGYDDVKITKTNNSVRAFAQLWLAYLNGHVIPKFGFLARPINLATVATTNLLAILLSEILPKNDDFFSNLVVQATKPVLGAGPH